MAHVSEVKWWSSGRKGKNIILSWSATGRDLLFE